MNKKQNLESLKLSDDQNAVAKRAIQEICSAASFLHELIERHDLCPDMRESIPHNLEHYLSDLCKAIGYSSDTEEKIKERNARLRKANQRIYELEKQMGEQADIHIIPKALKHLYDKIDKFWKVKGFGLIGKCSFTNYGMCDLTLSGHLFPHRGLSSFSETPETDKITAAQWIQNLINRGFNLAKETENSRKPEFVIDDQHNRDLIRSTIIERFPSAKIFGFTNHLMFGKSDIYHIIDIKVLIRELSDI